MARMHSGTKAAAKSAKNVSKHFVPGISLPQAGGKILRNVAGHITTGPFKELFQGQARAGLGGTPKKRARGSR